MKVNKQKLILLVFFIFLILSSVIKTCANTINLLEKGSITITLKEREEIQEAEITIFKIANAEIRNNNLTYVYIDEISGFDIEVDKLDNIEKIKNLAQYISKNNIKGITASTNSNGQVNFKDLSTGLYLVVETKGVTGYYNINPYIISIPAEENGEWIYNISSTPKVSVMKQPQESQNIGDQLIKTGQNIWPMVFFLVLGIICIIIGIVITIRRKKNEE